MWVVPLSWMLLLAAATGVPANAPGGSPLPAPIHTRQTLFAIPFRIQRAERTATEPVAVQLQVSTDGGKTWKVHSKVQPNLARFQFRADADGEYWFAVQTVDNEARLRPAQPGVPGLRVIVDTAPPQLELDARRGPNGEITVRWRVAEVNLDPVSVRLVYRTDVSPSVQSVAIDRNQLTAGGPIRSGDVSWWPQNAGNRVEIRAEVRDWAGNVAVTHAQVNLQDPPPAQVGGAPAPQSAPPQTAGTPPTQGPGTAQNPLLHSASLPASDASVAIQINPAMGSRYSPQAAGEPNGENRSAGGDRPRLVNTRVFELQYDIDSVGPSGIAQVELWGTRDGGQTWRSLGTDEDKKSPFLVTVAEEGSYGFRITVRSGVGLGGEPPAGGTPPDVRVDVDLTKPDVRILSAEQLTGNESGKVIIRWEAHDRMLARQGVSLAYSPSPGGPWLPVAKNLENSGQHAWMAGKDVPERIYLRVEARDEAGNLGIFESPQAIALDRVRPNVHIRDIRPIGESGRVQGRFSR